jgi:hypothetical protein
VAATPASANPSPPAEDWNTALGFAYDALLSAGASELDGKPGLAERDAAVQLAGAVLERFGIHRPTDTNLTVSALARALVAEIELEDSVAAGKALADLYELALGKQGRQDFGAVYTPPEIVDFMVRELLTAYLADAVELDRGSAECIVNGHVNHLDDRLAETTAAHLLKLRLVDPAAGAGVFLLAAATRIAHLAERLVDLGVADLGELSSPYLALRRCCHGYELDGHTALIATAVLGLSTCAPGTALPAVVTRRDPLLEGMRHAAPRDGWDAVVMNPPYMGGKHVRSRLGEDVSATLRQIDGFGGDLLAHFLLRALQGVREGGVVSAIVSDTAFTIEATAALRHRLLDEALLVSVAWCKPFESVAVRGGIVTVVRRQPRASLAIECRDASAGENPALVPARKVARRLYRALPGRPIYRPSPAAQVLVGRWSEVDSLHERWRALSGRAARTPASQSWTDGAWTLLGCAVRAGQGLATGDDRRFVGYLSETPEGVRALARQREIRNLIREDPSRRGDWARLRRRLGAGQSLGAALLELGDRVGVLPGRKPFLTVERSQVRDSPLTPREIELGIAEPPYWVPYETSDRSADGRGVKWWRQESPVVLDWSARAVALLRERRRNGPRRPVLRNEDLWFQGGVTHNRISSYLAARLMPGYAIFSSESPLYVPEVSWLTPYALLALLNSPVVEFALKTFLASRNHIEVGHVRRLPVPVLNKRQTGELDRLGGAAIAARRAGASVELADVEARLDAFTRELYGVGELELKATR